VTIPTQLALSFFGILHVPINIPALAVSLRQDVDLNREILSHGFSNILSGLCGSCQVSYLPFLFLFFFSFFSKIYNYSRFARVIINRFRIIWYTQTLCSI
jgi:hypothetical protein